MDVRSYSGLSRILSAPPLAVVDDSSMATAPVPVCTPESVVLTSVGAEVVLLTVGAEVAVLTVGAGCC